MKTQQPPIMPTRLVERNCIACGSHVAAPLYRELVTCTRCGLIYFPKLLSSEAMNKLYAEDYFNGNEYFDYLGDRRVHERNFCARARQLVKCLPTGKRLFEIGSSYGFFLNVAKDYWQVRGCDIAKEAACYAREELKLSVDCADFADISIQRGEFDAFCMWDTIEHLDNPESNLARISDLLEPGGIFTLTTGDVGSWLARCQGQRWRQIHPPTHIWYFSRETIQRTLERFGFEMVSFHHVGIWRSLDQIVYSLTSLGRSNPSLLHRLCMKMGVGRIGIWLNTFDLMMVIARKREQ